MNDPIETPAPIAVNPSAVPAASGTIIGMLMVLATGFPAILALVSARDLIGAIQWMQGTQGAAFLAAAGFVATAAWRIVTSLRKHAHMKVAAASADDAVAYVKSNL